MKLRFHENTLRLRLSQSEVAQFKKTGRVENTVAFAPGQALEYTIESGAVPALTASFESGRIRVMVPSAAARQWADSDETGVEGESSALRIAVEKDYQCLHRDSAEDADAFPNPLAAR